MTGANCQGNNNDGNHKTTDGHCKDR